MWPFSKKDDSPREPKRTPRHFVVNYHDGTSERIEAVSFQRVSEGYAGWTDMLVFSDGSLVKLQYVVSVRPVYGKEEL